MKIEDIDIDDLLGAVCYGSRWHFFVCTVAEWILDYETYDPSVLSPFTDSFVFRDNLFKVDDSNFSEFIEAIKEFELALSEIRELLEFDGANNRDLLVVIDYDKKIYVNGFREIDIHNYVPDNWYGFEGDPLDFVPSEVQDLWKAR
ncbi:MAG: hypothetical protein SVX43_09745 [Cyanobacteriota bacterium]|nr:hypothetical protein [Cyanobacteriota bacterium]